MTKEKKRSIYAGIGLLTAAFIWGFAFVVVKSSLDMISPIYMLAYRFTIAGIGLLLIFYKKLKNLNIRIIKSGFILGMLLFLSYLFQTIGCKYTTAGKNAFLTTIYVVLVPFLHWLIRRKRPDAYCAGAAFLAIVGIGLLSLEGDLTINIGDILTLICGFGYALHMIYIDKYTELENPILLTIVQIVYAAVFSWCFAVLFEGGIPAATFQVEIIAGMLYLGVLSTMVSFLLQNVCQKYTTASTAAILLSTESVFGALCAAIFLEEIMSLRMIVGCVLMFIAIIMAETKFEFLKSKLPVKVEDSD